MLKGDPDHVPGVFFFNDCLQGGPLQVINRVITPINGLING